MTQPFELPNELTEELMQNSHLYCPLIDDPDFKYYGAASTDVTRTWRKYGWTPIAEQMK